MGNTVGDYIHLHWGNYQKFGINKDSEGQPLNAAGFSRQILKAVKDKIKFNSIDLKDLSEYFNKFVEGGRNFQLSDDSFQFNLDEMHKAVQEAAQKILSFGLEYSLNPQEGQKTVRMTAGRFKNQINNLQQIADTIQSILSSKEAQQMYTSERILDLQKSLKNFENKLNKLKKDVDESKQGKELITLQDKKISYWNELREIYKHWRRLSTNDLKNVREEIVNIGLSNKKELIKKGTKEILGQITKVETTGHKTYNQGIQVDPKIVGVSSLLSTKTRNEKNTMSSYYTELVNGDLVTIQSKTGSQINSDVIITYQSKDIGERQIGISIKDYAEAHPNIKLLDSASLLFVLNRILTPEWFNHYLNLKVSHKDSSENHFSSGDDNIKKAIGIAGLTGIGQNNYNPSSILLVKTPNGYKFYDMQTLVKTNDNFNVQGYPNGTIPNEEKNGKEGPSETLAQHRIGTLLGILWQYHITVHLKVK